MSDTMTAMVRAVEAVRKVGVVGTVDELTMMVMVMVGAMVLLLRLLEAVRRRCKVGVERTVLVDGWTDRSDDKVDNAESCQGQVVKVDKVKADGKKLS